MTDSQIHGTRAATGARAATGSQDQTPQPPHAPPAPPGLGNALNANIHPGSKLTISLNIRPLPARGDDELVGVGAMFDDQTAEADDRDFGTELRI
ncbi:hypothetical protein PMZ80_008342 [Knufia obscura]|uniref:Uncharacterized protein n=2 Tax=Knufia TaxID=430999 RepID=A0AAN8I2H0_9EURO|nr:hypothetical protein PMZ80_008342 [Knufia obscura]KAK5951227.1 hypothetical protein OHC33_007645 [Knufia fluminis]